ncbi:hypothetical protein MKX03_007800 [Papaver bracteatum]|nr:hypothetical protein MKX03_007800 [Papaver bracteatum]
MAKDHLSCLSFGFFLVIAFSQTRLQPKKRLCWGSFIRVNHDCRLKTGPGCGPTCSKQNLEANIRISSNALMTYRCEAKKVVDTNSCNNPQNCEFECIMKADLYGPSQCKQIYEWNYVPKCYCCDRENSTTSNIVAVA